jgi:arsenate reductase
MTDTYDRPELGIDQQYALSSAARILSDDFDGVYRRETIERFLYSSYDLFADHATVPTYLPLLAERFARQRLKALARVEGHDTDGKPIVLFLCVHNSGRSQMAMGFFTYLAAGAAVAWSGGSEPADKVNAAAVEAMREVGIDISEEFPKLWTDEVVRAADVVVTMGCGDACPVYPGKRYQDWVLDDPAGLTVEAVRPIRDQIEQRVRALLARPGPVQLTGDSAAASRMGAAVGVRGSLADVVIAMGCPETCPVIPGTRYEDGSVDDAAGQDVDTVRRSVDDVDARVRSLLADFVRAG